MLTPEEIKELDCKAGLPEKQYRQTVKIMVCKNCGQEYVTEVMEKVWPQLVQRCDCGAPIIQRSAESEPEYTCACTPDMMGRRCNTCRHSGRSLHYGDSAVVCNHPDDEMPDIPGELNAGVDFPCSKWEAR